MTSIIEKLNWKEIQKYYDEGNTWKDISKKYKISIGSISKASKNNLLISRNASESMIVYFKNNTRTLSEETKKKISESRKKYLMQNPDKVPYKLNHYSKGPSYPETYFDEIFQSKFKYEKYLQIGYYHIDFAITTKKIAIEVDGDQHYLDEKIVESDKRKNKYLIDKGWDIIRIKWSDYQKMKRLEKEKYVHELVNYVNHLISIKPEIKILPKYICKCGNKMSKTGKVCTKCSHFNQRRVKDRPAKEELILMIKNSSLEAVGRKYGITGNAVKKWLK